MIFISAAPFASLITVLIDGEVIVGDVNVLLIRVWVALMNANVSESVRTGRFIFLSAVNSAVTKLYLWSH